MVVRLSVIDFLYHQLMDAGQISVAQAGILLRPDMLMRSNEVSDGYPGGVIRVELHIVIGQRVFRCLIYIFHSSF
jgi:hypothetical protein